MLSRLENTVSLNHYFSDRKYLSLDILSVKCISKMKWFLPGTVLLIWAGAFFSCSSISCKSLFLVKTLNVVRFAIKPCVWSCQAVIQGDFKSRKTSPQPESWTWLCRAHHISISLLADADEGPHLGLNVHTIPNISMNVWATCVNLDGLVCNRVSRRRHVDNVT